MYDKKDLHPNLFQYKKLVIRLICALKRKSGELNNSPDSQFVKSFSLFGGFHRNAFVVRSSFIPVHYINE